MKIFKFGGASVKDAAAVRNLVNILQAEGTSDTLIVVSAMGKMTNAFETVVSCYLNDKDKTAGAVAQIKTYHHEVLDLLFANRRHPVFKRIDALFKELHLLMQKITSRDYDFVYDQIVGYGELLSSSIVSQYLLSVDIANTWIDVRNFIKTDTTHREASLNWVDTTQNISTGINKKTLYITQGFLGSDGKGNTTTLGREGSDYTAAIFAYCLDARDVTIWKDVPGVLNADPRYFKKTRLLKELSYTEAIELAFYGASVIHPKTLQPLQRKNIPLYVRSFVKPKLKGSLVGSKRLLKPMTPCFILKKNQILLSLSSADFSFIVEKNISEIFELLHEHQMKVDMIQNSAISFSVCVDNKFNNLPGLLPKLEKKFIVTCTTDVTLFTIRHCTNSALRFIEKGRNILLKQRLGETVQIVCNEEVTQN